MSATLTSYNPTYRYGETQPLQVPYKSGVAVNVGDLCYVDTSDGNTIKPAMSFTWTTNLATTQPLFVDQFVGVAGQAYDGSNSNAIGIQDGSLVALTSGVFDYPCASHTWGVGDLVGVAQDGANSNLAGQVVAPVATVGLAIGRCVLAGTSLTTVRVKIFAPYANLVNAGAA